jgi:hypothetical protein
VKSVDKLFELKLAAYKIIGGKLTELEGQNFWAD